MRYRTRSSRNRSSGPPAWFVFIIGVALVFGVFYLWQGVQNFFLTGGGGVSESTQQAALVTTATADRVTRAEFTNRDVTPRPSSTPVPECQDFIITVPNAIVREAPNPNGPILTSYNEGTTVCVLERAPTNDEWFVIDQTPGTRRLDLGYMHESVIRAVNPTLTPSRTVTPWPTVTPLPTDTATPRPTITPTRPAAIPNPVTPTDSPISPTPAPTEQPTETPIRQIAMAR